MKSISIKILITFYFIINFHIFLALAIEIDNIDTLNNPINNTSEITRNFSEVDNFNESINYSKVILNDFEINGNNNNNSNIPTNVPEKYDPNWLYSTISQSSAAIIGIIGAFLTSKILMISGEKKSLLKRRAELKLEIKNLEDNNKEMQDYCSKIDRKIALKDIESLLKLSDLSDFRNFNEIWLAYKENYSNVENYCNDVHKKLLQERYNTQ